MGILDAPQSPLAQYCEFRFDPAGRPNGSIPLPANASLFPSLSSPAPLVIAGGKITHTPYAGIQSAGYLQAQLREKVIRVGAMVAWPANALGALTLVLPVSAWASGLVTGAAVHLTLRGNGIWALTRITANEGGGITSTTIADNSAFGRYETVWDGVMRPVELHLDPARSRVTIVFPDGTRTVVTSPYFATETTNLAIWELYEDNGATDVSAQIGEIWADSAAPARAGRPVDQQAAYEARKRATAIFNANGTVLVDGLRADVHMITLTGGNLTTLYTDNLQPAQVLEIHFVQDATGSRTLSGATSIFKWAGGSPPTLTTTAGRRDIFRFRYTRGVLYEISRSMNVG